MALSDQEIALSFYALAVRCDSYLRPFLYFMAASFLAELGAWVVPLLMEGSCAMVPKGLKVSGMAAACGFMKVLFAVFFCQLAAIEAYLIFAVWSLCEDMKVSMKGHLPKLLVHKTHREPVGDPAAALFGGQNRGLGYGAF
ncbi:unnamed protein product [Symbiodinium natans]|uniref:Uncharacterized protein n=1 Tax=Symbiodinium natans TaxID=878477 RepID=A0A812IIR5_9DINO|nr:unnamed protein product [Symbiodinium natans]